MRCSPPSALERLAGSLAEGLTRELHLTPKPGLVDLEDSGSHHDLTFITMERSVALVRHYFGEVVVSLTKGEPLARQVAIGQAAEQRMMAQLGANTHKGAIFLGGLLLTARFRASSDDDGRLRQAIGAVARELLARHRSLSTHGETARRRFGVGGILQESLAGLPSIFDVALPAFRSALRRQQGIDAASFAMLAQLMRTVEDTTALHRGGRAGLERIHQDGAHLEQLLEQSGDHLAFLRQCNTLYQRLNLTMGGVADLLGMALGLLVYRGEIPIARS